MYYTERKISHDLATLALVIVLAVALLPPGTIPVAAESPAVAPPSDQPAFHQDRFTEDRGDIVTVGVDVGDMSNVTLRVEPANDSASEFTAEVVVYDRNDDGRIDVQINTYALGHDARPVSASGTDTVHVRESASLDHRLRVGEYRLILDSANETVDQSMLVVQPASFDDLRVLTANGTQPANLSSRAAVETAIENETFDDNRRFSTHDTLLIELEASGVSGALANQPGPNATAKFLNLFDGPSFSFTMQESYKSIDTEESPAELTPTPASTTVVADTVNDTYYVLLDAARMSHHERGKPDAITRVEKGDVFDVNVTVTDLSGIYESSESRISQVTYIPWVTAEIPTTVDAAANQTIEMDSNLDTNWGLSVVLRSDDGWSRSAQTVEVKDGGTIVATFDLSDRSPGETLTLVVERKGFGVLYSEQDTVHVQSTTPTPSPTEMPPPPSPVPTSTATAPDPTERSPTGTSGSAPGFGMGAALVALAVATAIASRRR